MCIGTTAAKRLPVLLLYVKPSAPLRAFSFRKSSNFSALIPIVLLSTSTKTGFAPVYDIALQVAIKETGCVITSSSALTPASNKQICKAEVPFTAAIAYLLPVYSHIACSNFPTYSPTDETKLLSIASNKYFLSFPIKRGSCKIIKPLSSLKTSLTKAVKSEKFIFCCY